MKLRQIVIDKSNLTLTKEKVQKQYGEIFEVSNLRGLEILNATFKDHPVAEEVVEEPTIEEVVEEPTVEEVDEEPTVEEVVEEPTVEEVVEEPKTKKKSVKNKEEK